MHWWLRSYWRTILFHQSRKMVIFETLGSNIFGLVMNWELLRLHCSTNNRLRNLNMALKHLNSSFLKNLFLTQWHCMVCNAIEWGNGIACVQCRWVRKWAVDMYSIIQCLFYQKMSIYVLYHCDSLYHVSRMKIYFRLF